MKATNILRLFSLGTLAMVSCAKSDDLNEFSDNNRLPKGVIRVDIDALGDTRAEFTERDKEGAWHLDFSAGDDMVLWEVANVESRGYYHIRTHQSTAVNLSEDMASAQFTYSVPSPYVVGEPYPGTSSYTTEKVFYTGILPKSAFAGFWANYPVNDVDPSVKEASDGFIRLNVPRVQTPSATSPDKSAIILRTYDGELGEDGVISTKFQHLMAYMKITVKGLPAGYNFHKLQIGGDSRIVFANDTDYAKNKYCKWTFGNAKLYNGNGFDATNRGSTLIINTSHLQPEADGSYVVWAACMPYTSPYVATPSFTPYSSENEHIESKLIPISRTGETEDGSKAVNLKVGEVAEFTINYGYGNDLIAPDIVATTKNIDPENSSVTFSWNEIGGVDHYTYKINDGEELTTTQTTVTINAKPGERVTIAVKACPAADSGYAESGWSTKSITAEIYRITLQMSEIDEGDVLSYKATLMWSSVENAVGYAYKIGENGAQVNIGNVTEYTFTGLKAETYYSIYLRALAEEGSTTYADSEWVEKLILTSEKSPLTMSEVTVTEVGERKVTLEWGAVEGAASYLYKLSTGDEGVAESGKPITGLEPSTTYSIQIKAIAEVESDWSDSDWGSAKEFTTQIATNTYLWDYEFWAEWHSELGTDILNADATYRGLSYTLGTGKGWDFMTENGNTFVRSKGNADKGKNYFSFPATGSGKILVKGRNDKGSAKTMRFILDSTDLTELSLDANSEFSIELDITATEGNIIKVAPRDEKICIFSIEWIPAE